MRGAVSPQTTLKTTSTGLAEETVDPEREAGAFDNPEVERVEAAWETMEGTGIRTSGESARLLMARS